MKHIKSFDLFESMGNVQQAKVGDIITCGAMKKYNGVFLTALRIIEEPKNIYEILHEIPHRNTEDRSREHIWNIVSDDERRGNLPRLIAKAEYVANLYKHYANIWIRISEAQTCQLNDLSLAKVYSALTPSELKDIAKDYFIESDKDLNAFRKASINRPNLKNAYYYFKKYQRNQGNNEYFESNEAFTQAWELATRMEKSGIELNFGILQGIFAFIHQDLF